MGDYSQAAEYYDTLYASQKDYAAEAELLASLIRAACPEASSVLDVGCGTGEHARHLIDAGFHVDGIDVEPEFVAIASEKCPEGTFRVADMRSFELPERYDAVVSLFSAIGYARDETGLGATLGRMREHLVPGGVVVVDPWFAPGELTDGWISTHVGKTDRATVCRMSRTLLQDGLSRLEFEYLIGTADGIERRSEVHELGLFTQEQMEEAFVRHGLRVERKEKALRTRGIYVGVVAGDAP